MFANSVESTCRSSLPFRSLLTSLVCCLTVVVGAGKVAGDEVTLVQDGQQQILKGTILVEAQDGSLLFQTADGRLWIVAETELVASQREPQPVEPLKQKAMEAALLAELPDDFRIHTTKHFVIAYQTERVYARWVGGLYERLYSGFEKFWDRKKKFPLNKPTFPLTAIVFRSRADYTRYVQRELGSEPGTMVAYYNLMSNRVAMYDLTADQRRPGQALENDRGVYQILSNPNSLPMVATVIHEGTHQLMFNTGMQTRFSDTPLWINEGLAMYFETPDMNASRGWRAIGRINYPRFRQFRAEIPQRTTEALAELIGSDNRFQNSETALSAYAEAWALNYYLLNERSKDYVRYLKFMATKKPLMYDTPAQRLADFCRFFGDDLQLLDREFVAYMAELNLP